MGHSCSQHDSWEAGRKKGIRTCLPQPTPPDFPPLQSLDSLTVALPAVSPLC